MPLDIHAPDLFVLTVTVTDRKGAHKRVARSMPAAPFGSAAWQMLHLVAYLGKLHNAKDQPTAAGLDAHLSVARSVPVPHQPYPYNALHDRRITCLVDLALGPANGLGWPQASLVVLEQDTGPCGFIRTARYRGAAAITAYTTREITAEHQRLADLARRTGHPAVARLRDGAEQAAQWAQRLEKAARAAYTLSRAAQVRAQVRAAIRA